MAQTAAFALAKKDAHFCLGHVGSSPCLSTQYLKVMICIAEAFSCFLQGLANQETQ